MNAVSPRDALILRLVAHLPDTPEAVRTLRERLCQDSAGFEPARNDLAAALAGCVTALRNNRARMGNTTPPEPIHARKTIALPDVIKPASGRGKSKQVRWSAEERALYEDILTLFDLGDQLGALTSLERLVVLSPDAVEMAAFLDKNGPALREIYQAKFGSMERVPLRCKDRHPIRIPARKAELVIGLLRLVDGKSTIHDIVRKPPCGELVAMIVLSHMLRSGFVELV